MSDFGTPSVASASHNLPHHLFMHLHLSLTCRVWAFSRPSDTWPVFSFNLLFCLLLSFRLQRTLSAVSVPAQLVASFVDAPASFSNIAYFGIISTLRHSACFSPTHFRCCCMRILGLALSFGQQRTLSAVSFLAQPAIVC